MAKPLVLPGAPLSFRRPPSAKPAQECSLWARISLQGLVRGEEFGRLESGVSHFLGGRSQERRFPFRALDFQMEMRSQSRCQMSLRDMSQVLGICHTCIPHTGEETGPPARPAGPTGTRLRLRGLRDHRCPHGVGKGCARTALQQLFLLF